MTTTTALTNVTFYEVWERTGAEQYRHIIFARTCDEALRDLRAQQRTWPDREFGISVWDC